MLPPAGGQLYGTVRYGKVFGHQNCSPNVSKTSSCMVGSKVLLLAPCAIDYGVLESNNINISKLDVMGVTAATLSA